MNIPEIDCCIVGAGPAGLTAAIFLARFRRSFRLFGAGDSRAAWIPRSHNHPAFPGGINGHDLLQRMRRQLGGFGHSPVSAAVTAVVPMPDGRFKVTAGDDMVLARHLILATGVRDHLPPVRDAVAHVLEGRIRQCPICDGYEMTDRRLAVIGHEACAAGEALFLRSYTDRITIVTLGRRLDLPPAALGRLRGAGIVVQDQPVRDIRFGDDRIVEICLEDHVRLTFDAIYSGLGVTAQSDLGEQLGLELTPDRRIVTDRRQECSVPGVYAAGDVVTGLNQIAVAMAQAEIAAVEIHNRLRREELRVLPG
ncbi:NAD(P)/FAD-dependent oxidoreductase [Plastorhodobacter daqingensis]|uniref:Thioredoxin reductase n=1 Tax=Plastorhodobacter daqingensis TaxID=1387281 RepID=A0ABW2UMR3_9RHOB